MRTEISQAKKEANFYLQNVEKAKAIEAMEERKRKRSDVVRKGGGEKELCVGRKYGGKERERSMEGGEKKDGGVREGWRETDRWTEDGGRERRKDGTSEGGKEGGREEERKEGRKGGRKGRK